MQTISGPLIDALKNLGLTNYEARIYAGLVLYNAAEAKELVDFLGISKPSIYEGLDRLEEMGLAVKRNSKPAMYSSVQPEIAIRILMDGHTNSAEIALKELNKLEQEKVHEDRSDVVWTMYGDSNIERKIRSMLRNAQKSIECMMGDRYLAAFDGINVKELSLKLLVISDKPGLLKKLRKQFPGKNHEITVISLKKIKENFPPHRSMPDPADLMRIENVLNIIVDNSELLSIPPIPTNHLNGMNTSNKALILHMRAMNEEFWNRILEEG